MSFLFLLQGLGPPPPLRRLPAPGRSDPTPGRLRPELKGQGALHHLRRGEEGENISKFDIRIISTEVSRNKKYV